MRRKFVRKFALGALALSLCAGAPVGAIKQEGASVYNERFEQIVKATQQRFYDKDLHQLDWDKTAQTYRVKLKTVKTKAEFVVLVNAMLAELRASHIEYIPDDDVGFALFRSVMGGGFTGNEIAHIGVMGTRQNGQYIVSGVLEGYPAQKVGIKSGDVLLTVNGKPFETAGSFRGGEGKPHTLMYGGPRGTTGLVEVTPIKENPLKSYLTATKRSIKTLNIEGKKIGYIHLWTMANDEFRALLENTVLGELHNTDGLILDLRDGHGGRPWGYADPFFLPDIVWEQQMRGTKMVQTKSGYGKPMVVLINKGTRSAKEFFSYQFKKTKRATLVGTPTAGAFLGASMVPIGKDSILELPVVNLRVDGQRLEGVGVAPDIVVEPSDTYGENDAQFREAKRVLMEKLGKQSEQ